MKIILKKQGLIKLILGFSVASWVSAVINFIILPISTRVFEPAQLASINLFYAIFTMVSWVAILGLDQGYIRYFHEKETEVEKKNLLSVCMALSVIALVFIAVSVIPFQTEIAVWVLNDDNNMVVLFLFICALNAVVQRYISLFHRMRNSVILFTVTTVCASAVIKLSYLGAAVFDANYYTAIILMVITSAIFLTFTVLVNRKNINLRISIKRALKPSLLKFSFPLMPISIMAILNNDIPQYFLRGFDELSQLGVYTSAVTLAGIITLLQSGLNVFWGPFVFRNYKNEVKSIMKMHEIIVFLMVAFAILIIAFQDIIILLLGENYRTVTDFLPFLLFSPVSYTIAETTGVGIALEKKSNINLLIYASSIIVNFFACYILIPLYGVEGAAISSAIAASFMLILKTIFGQKYFRSIRRYRYMIAGMAVLLIVAITNVKFNMNDWLCLAINSFALIGLSVFFDLNSLLKSCWKEVRGGSKDEV